MGLKQFLQNADRAFQRIRTTLAGPEPSTPEQLGLLTPQQRGRLRRDVERMTAVASLQRHEGFGVLIEVAGELADGHTRELMQMSPGRFRGPWGIEAKGIAKALTEYGLQQLADRVIERGVTAQRMLNEDQQRRVALARPAGTVRV
jgi:hypothetical protein